MRSQIFLLLLFACVASSAFAEPMQSADIPYRINSWDIQYEVNTDGSFIATTRWSKTVLKENILTGAKKASVTFSTSVAKGEILEAYTLKNSGERIDAPKNSYQMKIHDGYKEASPLYSDETTISVVFPDLAVGDTVIFSSRVANSEGIFPNQFSVSYVYSRYVAVDTASFEIIAPADLDLKSQSYFLDEEKHQNKDGKQVIRWTFHNPIPEKWTPADNGIFSVGEDPSLYVSTFKNYEEIAQAYGSRATPKAAVSKQVEQLANVIVADQTTPEMQARLLYNWVAKNISYGGKCIGIGAAVPRDLSVVLDNKLGDCKDHATLLQALLAAKDIESEQALINTRGIYTVPDVPVVAAVNHVINYIPAMDLFLDSTSANIPFPMLPMTLGEKPVLLVSSYREGMKTPSTALGHEQIIRTRIRINADGSASGNARMKLKGLPAIVARATLRAIPSGQDELLAKKMLVGQGMRGKGTLEKDDPAPLLDTYNLNLSFSLEDYVTTGSPTGIVVKPVTSSFFPIERLVAAAYEPVPNKNQMCLGGSSTEEYILEFPESLKIMAIPNDYQLTTASIDYRSTYQMTDNTLTVRREFKDKTKSNVCSPELMAGYKKAALDIVRDLKAQVLVSN